MQLPEERTRLQLGKGAHVDVGSFHLQLVHFADFVSKSRFLEGLFPVWITVVLVGRFFQPQLHAFDFADILDHFRNDFFPHLFVYFFRFLALQQLQADAVQVLAQLPVFVEQAQAYRQFGVELAAFGICVQGQQESG